MKSNSKAGLQSIRGHHFYGSLINSDSIVIDLGSHLGQFSHAISDVFGCKCYAIEALPSLYNQIIETPLIKKFNYAISSSDEPVEFCVSENPEANHIAKLPDDTITEKIKVQGVTLASFLEQQNIKSVDLLKIDIEGAEIDLFNSISDEDICRFKQITVEFHDFVFDINKQVEEIKTKLKSLGFICIVFSMTTNGDVLFLNKNKIFMPIIDYIYVRYLARYTRAISRKIKII